MWQTTCNIASCSKKSVLAFYSFTNFIYFDWMMENSRSSFFYFKVYLMVCTFNLLDDLWSLSCDFMKISTPSLTSVTSNTNHVLWDNSAENVYPFNTVCIFLVSMPYVGGFSPFLNDLITSSPFLQLICVFKYPLCLNRHISDHLIYIVITECHLKPKCYLDASS